jgi:penicillin amidase
LSSERKRRWPARLLRVGALTLAILLLVAAGLALWLRSRLVASLPTLDGAIELHGLAAPIEIERDELGVPTISGRGALDVARALGFLHGQERFFQMDLLRRKAAGELAAIVGPGVLELDRETRVHRFRARAARGFETATPEGREILTAYADAVNAGLAALGDVPPEYLALRVDPQPWRPEDSTLVVMAMYLELQGYLWSRESSRGLLFDTLPPALADFLMPAYTEWDAPIVGPTLASAPVPGPDVIDLTAQAEKGTFIISAQRGNDECPLFGSAPLAGSNNWAVHGSRAADGAMVANDMHLGLGMPNIWYRASLVEGEGPAARRVTGVTLPGVPAIVAGSNGRIAWGFTNTGGDWADLIVLETDPADPDRYLTADGARPFEHFTERIAVKGDDEVVLDVLETQWGPVVDSDAQGRRRALRWVAHLPGGTDIGLLRIVDAGTVEDALDIAARAGMPAQNMMVADAGGHIGWSVAGRIPVRQAGDATRPLSWSEAGPPWTEWLDPSLYPRVVDPEVGRLWTANNRVVDSPLLDAIRDGGFDLGARARQIRDDLLALDRATEADMLAIQLDDHARLVARWRGLLLEVLATSTDPRHAELARWVEQSWDDRASIDSVGYRMARAFRIYTARQIFSSLAAPALERNPELRWGEVTAQYEGPLWQLVTQRPAHLLDRRFASWDAMLLAAVDEALDGLAEKDGRVDFARLTWGARNTVLVRHPLSLAVPRLSRWLDVAARPLPGDEYMPRVQATTFGASERFAVSPGHEERGLFHMPGGQSGHFLSPFYRAGHDAWAEGRPTPFLPGPAQHHLTLTP